MSQVQEQLNPPQLATMQAEPTIERYFASFNAGDFQTTAALFSAAGQLQPPFEEAIVGVDAIAAYLEAEAEGMQAYPQSLEVESHLANNRRIVVRGWVKAIVFKVNTAWIFDLDEQGYIQGMRVKLLASMQELLNLRP